MSYCNMFVRHFHHLKLIKTSSLFDKPCISFARKFQREVIRPVDRSLLEKFGINQPLSKGEWKDLRSKILNAKNGITTVTVDATILRSCLPSGQLDIGKSYIEYLKESGIEPNIATTGQLLKLYYRASKCGVEITTEDQKDIIDLHKHLLNKFTVLDSRTCENLIYALVLTKDWRKCLDLLQMIKTLAKPLASTYSMIVERALEVDDVDLAWKLLYEMLEDEKVPNSVAFISYICYCRRNPNTFTDNVDKILKFIGEYQILVSKKVVDELHDAFKDNGFTSIITSASMRGRCRSCNKHLKDVVVTNAEFQQLSQQFLNKILIGQNVFLKSSPEEVTNFIKFINRTKPYDCVIDGLNVSYATKNGRRYRSPENLSRSIVSVVKHFVNQNKSVLVVGRKHMQNWPAAEMMYIRKNSHLFLTENSSQDDPFLLYAALQSGPNTDFVSRDCLRNHAFLFDKDLKSIFRRWQRQHQYGYDSKPIIIREPIRFNTSAHQVEGCWHIPFIDGVCTIPNDFFNLSTTWLCVSKNKNIDRQSS